MPQNWIQKWISSPSLVLKRLDAFRFNNGTTDQKKYIYTRRKDSQIYPEFG